MDAFQGPRQGKIRLYVCFLTGFSIKVNASFLKKLKPDILTYSLTVGKINTLEMNPPPVIVSQTGCP